ncbi:hypothetical protein BHF71_03275 [Vulcanibacillus modesticaldus]|uniref:Fimbrial assembly protein n=1 Tax=Vulcanibacillus modesticaldus TaxID=337097 RepID=A0A1D2YSR1_9BACI|nr:hypothetical protein [Vulcanibacillus modesticaldus]OEF98056.1 hypothetical protein BHF71_03275 [Vulcanibacillus modesticaldus]
MEINLLPEIPATKKFLWPIAIIAAILIISTSSLVSWHIWEKSRILADKNQQLELIKKQREQQQKILNKNKEDSQLFSAYLANYNSLIKKHVNLVPLIDDMSRLLPSNGYLYVVEWSEEGIINLIGEFPSLEVIGQYIQLLNELYWVKDISIKSVNESEFSLDLQSNQKSDRGQLMQFNMEIKIDLQSFYKKGATYNE